MFAIIFSVYSYFKGEETEVAKVLQASKWWV
jgi:hypothetical protein